MAATVKEIMNHELYALRRSDRVAATRVGILGMDITAAPVVDDAGRPIGVVSLRDLFGAADTDTAEQRMSSPAVVVRAGASVRDAAQLLGETALRRLVVIDDEGRAVGMVSAVDVLRGLIGIPARHPAQFPHLDAATGQAWTDDTRLDESRVEAAPDGPGVVVLIHDVAERPAHIVWVEWTHNVRTRLLDYLSLPQAQPELARWLERRDELSFRASAIADPGAAAAVVEELRPQHLPPPSPRAVR